MMKNKTILITSVGKAELVDTEIKDFGANDVIIETEYTAISPGTERANLMGMPNLGEEKTDASFPRYIGYSGVGIVKEVGKAVKKVSVGDRVLIRWGTHSQYNRRHENSMIKVGNLDPRYAAFVLISTFSAGGLRKTRLEFGESAMVIGIGLLGAFAVQLCRAAGAYPVIAADLNPKRRLLALDLGADYAFDPTDTDYLKKVKEVTNGKGVNVIIEATGQAAALSQALDCAARFGRVSLLGCTRVSNAPIDFYQQVHRPGVEIIGAHTDARPVSESRPYSWTEYDDCIAMLNYMMSGRIDMSKILTTEYSPDDAADIYKALAENNDFPVGAVFDWKKMRV